MLTWLNSLMFIKFYNSKYSKSPQNSAPSSIKDNAQQSDEGSPKDLTRELLEAMSTEQKDRETNQSDVPSEIASKTEKVNKGIEDLGNKTKHATDRAKDGVNQANDIFQDKLQAATDVASEKVNEQNKRWHEYQREQVDDLKSTKTEENEKENAKQDSLRSQNAKDESLDTPSVSSQDDASSKPEDKVPKLEPTRSFNDGSKKKSQSRSVSLQKKTQLPRPQSKNRSISPGKKNSQPKPEEKPQTNGNVSEEPKGEANQKNESKDEEGEDDPKPSSLEESAYEVNPDELENEEEKKAEAEMQPKSN